MTDAEKPVRLATAIRDKWIKPLLCDHVWWVSDDRYAGKWRKCMKCGKCQHLEGGTKWKTKGNQRRAEFITRPAPPLTEEKKDAT